MVGPSASPARRAQEPTFATVLRIDEKTPEEGDQSLFFFPSWMKVSLDKVALIK
jgi:hypothetical protein